mgnify:CR=1 FL=1
MGGGMEITKNREIRFVTLASDFNNKDKGNRYVPAYCP